MKVVEQRKRRKRVCVRRPHISFRFSGILKIAADAAALLQTCNNATLCWRKQDIHIHHTDGHKHAASMHCDSVGSAVGLNYATAAHTRRFAALTEQQRQWWNHALSNPLYTGFDGNQYALSRVYFFFFLSGVIFNLKDEGSFECVAKDDVCLFVLTKNTFFFLVIIQMYALTTENTSLWVRCTNRMSFRQFLFRCCAHALHIALAGSCPGVNRASSTQFYPLEPKLLQLATFSARFLHT